MAMGLAFISAGLVACGGGGGGASPGVPTTPPPTPTPVPTPYALGDGFTFSGSQNTVATFTYPSPSPYPSTNTTVTVAQTVTVAAGGNPYGPQTASDFHTVETDSSLLSTHASTTDAWLGLIGANLDEYGYHTTDDSNDSLTAAYTTPLVTDQLPETNGAAWSNGAGVTYGEHDSDGTTSTRTYSANGTYTESSTNGIGVKATITENADGSGSYVTNGTYLAGNVNSLNFTSAGSGQVSISVNYVQPPTPSPAPSGQPAPTPAPTITPLVYTAPAWYGTAMPVLYSQNVAVTTGVAYPASCSVPAAYGTSGNKIVQTTNRLDTILGYTDAQVQTTYTNSQAGPVCVVLQDTQNDYYDYQDDFATATGFHFHFPGTALSTTTASETLTLQAGAVVHDTGRRTESAVAQPLSLARVAAATASLTLRAERLRRGHENELVRFLSSLRQKGVR